MLCFHQQTIQMNFVEFQLSKFFSIEYINKVFVNFLKKSVKFVYL
jgi:hypothetical protein